MNVGGRVKVVRGIRVGKIGTIRFEAQPAKIGIDRKDIRDTQLLPKGFWIEAADGSEFFETADQLELEELIYNIS